MNFNSVFTQCPLLTKLKNFQKILLITDGTVTHLLEQYLGESIIVNKLSEKSIRDKNQLPALQKNTVEEDDLPVIHRRILLQGQSSHRNWLYAESTIITNHLPADFRHDLLCSKQPIGKLWVKYQLETYKTLIAAGYETMAETPDYFNLPMDTQLVARTYTVYSGGKIIMIITEKFPDCYFGEAF